MRTTSMPLFSSVYLRVLGAGLLTGLLWAGCAPEEEEATPPSSDPSNDEGGPCEPDWDGDGYLANRVSCVDAAGITHPAAIRRQTEDCQIYDVIFHPGALELVDGADNDCDGLVDEGTVAVDDDGDGYTELEGDCDDSLEAVNPGESEINFDGWDSNCDGYDGRTPPEADLEDPSTWEATSVSRASAVLYGPDDRANLMGWSAQVGDLDGDGRGELVVGLGYTNRETLEAEGTLYVLYPPQGGFKGALPLETQAAWSVHGLTSPNSVGTAARTGDLNGDGYQDLILGDLLQRTIAVFFGGPRRSGSFAITDADILFLGWSDEGFPIGLGYDSPGDLDLDGFDDLIIGQPDYDMERGRAAFFYGRESWPRLVDMSEADAYLHGQQDFDMVGAYVRKLGDLDLDGYPDVAIVAALEQHGEFDQYSDMVDNPSGTLYLLYGGPERVHTGPLRDTAQARLVADTSLSILGGMVLTTGDLDLDGKPDLAMGIPAEGEALVYYGRGGRVVGEKTLRSMADSTYLDSYYGEKLGEFVAVADISTTGYPELIVASNAQVYADELRPGHVALYAGTGTRPIEVWTYDYETKVQVDMLWGTLGLLEIVMQVSANGDLSDDGRDDLVVSTQLYPYQLARGAVYIFNGGIL